MSKNAQKVVSETPIFTVRETHGCVSRPGHRLIAHSQDIGWRSVYAAIIDVGPYHALEPAIRHPSFIYHLARPTEVTRQIEGMGAEKALIGPRRISVTPGEAATTWEHSGSAEILQVYLRQSVYARAVAEMYSCDPPAAELIPRFAIQDPLLEQISIAILGALRDGSSEDGLYVDTLAQMMAVHLARTHSTRSRPIADPRLPGLAGWRIRRLVEYIDKNLDGDLSLEVMAGEVEISPLHLARAFKSASGQSPHQYVLARRIEKAKELLRDTDMPIVEIALSVGFSSQSHLSNWFLRRMGVSPAIFRRQGTS